MGSPRGTKRQRGQLEARGTTVLTGSEGPVILAYGATTARIAGFLQNIRGNFNATPRYRKFPVRSDNPEDAAWTDGAAVTTNTPFSQDFSLAGLGACMFIQPAIGASVSAGAGGEAYCSWQAWIDTTAQIVASQTVQLEPTVNSTRTLVIPLGKGGFPALGLTGVMVAVTAREVVNSPVVNFVTRTFSGDATLPSAWGPTPLLATPKTFASLNEDYNTGNLPFAPSAVWAQLGLQVPAGSGDYLGTLDIVVAAKYS